MKCPTCSAKVEFPQGKTPAAAVCPTCGNPLHPPPAREPSPSFSSEVAGYHIIEPIARGAYGSVYRAVAPDGRTVALKVLTVSGTESSEAVARFQREAQAAMNLDHPGIVRVVDAGYADRRHFLAMEYIEGPSLRDLMEQDKIDLRRAIEIVRDVARALHHAHSRGIIHRDLKPENVLVTAEGVPKLSDFGIAKILHSASARLTATGIALGTPEYMSPEQARGHSHDVDQRSDIFTLGVILYEAAAGRLPFIGRTIVDTLKKIEREDPEPPSRVSPKVDTKLDAIILKAMAKAPEARYASAQELADDLDRWLKGAPPAAAKAPGLVGRLFGRKRK